MAEADGRQGRGRLRREHAIVRPTLVFGIEDILINNIAWLLRRFPVFGVFGDGTYRLQPIFVDDLARLAVEAAGWSENVVRDAIGPETFTYRELVSVIGNAIGRPRPIVSIPPGLGVALGRLVGLFVGDVVVTREEVAGLMQYYQEKKLLQRINADEDAAVVLDKIQQNQFHFSSNVQLILLCST